MFDVAPEPADVENRLHDFTERLALRPAFASYGGGSLTVRLTVDEDRPERAFELTLGAVMAARAQAGLGTTDPLRTEIEDLSQLERCAICRQALANERDREATAQSFGGPDGPRFICWRCAAGADNEDERR